MAALPSLSGFMAELRRRRVVRVAVVYLAASWLLIEVAGTVSDPLDLPGWFPTFVITLAALGLPIALGLAWAFDVTPAASTAGISGGASVADTRHWLLLPVAAVLLVAGAFAARSMSGDSPSAPATATDDTAVIQSIAVLPFVNMSSDAENEHFSDGLTEELLNYLAQVPGLRVAARTSSFAFKNDTVGITEIGRRLGVQTVLEGSVRRADNRVRITAQLIDARTNGHLWSKTYERQLEDIFAIQDEISTAIVQALGTRFAAAQPTAAEHATQDVAAYDLYLRARYRFWQGGGEASLREAATFYEQAVAADPSFSLAYAGLSDAYMLLAGPRPPSEVMPMAKQAALTAIDLDPRLAEGYVALASINWLYDWDWAAADQNYRLSFSVNPLLHTRCICYAWYLAVVGNQQAAVVEAERARSMDPVARLPRVILAWMYYLAGRADEARAEVDEVLAITPHDVSSRRIAAWILWDAGRREAAIAELNKLFAPTGAGAALEGSAPSIVLSELAFMYAATARHDDAKRLRDRLQQRARQEYVAPEQLAVAHAAAGDMDRAFMVLDEAVAARSNLGQFSILPLSRALRSDGRYRRVLEQIGLGPRASQLLAAAAAPADAGSAATR
jgi:adenylate cyclase